MTCPQCGQENPEGARFCNACAAPLDVEPAARETRKTVTVLFCDVAGYTATGERLDPEALRKLQSRYFDDVRAALERHGAMVEKFIGDAVMAVFGIPQVHEDDALRAARAALEVREAVEALGLKARIGLNTGEVVAGSGDALVTGDAVNVAARLEQAAEPGVILIGDATHRLLSGAVTSELVGPLSVKGKTEPLGAWRLLEVLAGAEAISRRLDSPMVGREREREALSQAFDRMRGERSCHLFTILGAAGVGKSRLVAELLNEARGEAGVAVGRCLPYGEGITYWPLYEVLDELGGEASKAVRDLIETGASSPEELFFAVRKHLEELAGERPLVVVFDDVHWAEPTFLDFVDHVSDWSRDAPILLICLARPELLDERPAWGGGKLNATSVLLEPLPEIECELLIRNLLGAAELAPDARGRILEAAEGNPLFVEEMLEMLIDDGMLERRNGSWVAAADLGDVTVPPTIQALLSARLDRLSADERVVAERAAVQGKVFHRGAIAELAPEALRPEVSAHLLSLVRKELVRPDESAFADEDAFRFRHLLVRDAAYDSLPKEARADLHERFADWLEAKVGERRAEYEEILGYHLEQASRYRAELGSPDEELARRAAARLAAAGRRAQERGDMPGAVNLLERAASLPPAEDPERIRLLPQLGAALRDTGELTRAVAVLREALSAARASGDRRSEAYATLQLGETRAATDPTWRHQDALKETEGVIAAFETLGDDLGLARAWQFVCMYELWAGRCAAAERAYEKSFEHARLAGDEREVAAVPWAVIGAALMGPRTAAEAEARCSELAERAKGHRYIEALSLIGSALCAAMRGDRERARLLAVRGKQMMEELGSRLGLAGTSQLLGSIESLRGDESAAEREYREGYDLSVELGETGYLSTTACYLGETAYAQGRYGEALRLSEESEQAGASDDVSTQIRWRALRAKVLARQGQLEQAKQLAHDAVQRSRRTDYIDETAQTLGSLAEVFELAGDLPGARSALEEALQLYDQKGNVVSAGRTRDRLASLEAQ
jgi:class 3 adenylate cyclase